MSEKEKEEELKNITKLLLRTVHRKFELQQEINAWEVKLMNKKKRVCTYK